jgi:acetyltransferase-like isoleucine patch superfamily enzyme
MKRALRAAYWALLRANPWTRPIWETRTTQTPIRPGMWFAQKVLGFNKGAYWPVHFTSYVGDPRNVYAGIEVCPGYMPGCYIQSSFGKIYIGDYTQIARNVGIITANHDLNDNRKHSVVRDVRIGKYCWLGMNSVILPGVELGDYTVVGAGTVVTKSFPEGYCVLAGSPAKVIKKLDPSECVFHKSEHEYNGYIRSGRFDEFRRKYLNV